MSTSEDTAALIAQMREHIAAWDRDMMSIYDNKRIPFVQTAADLCDALSRAQADAARMRNALQYARNLIGPDEIVDAALEPRHD